MLLLSEVMQWVVNCADAPSGFTRTASQLRGRPVFARSGGKFETDGRSLSTEQLLAVMAATTHVDELGLQRSDLPPRQPWLVLGSLAALRQYHPAFEQASTEAWLSVAMHELMHAQALRVPSFATTLHRINDHELDPKALAELYTRDPAYRALVDHEYAQLVAATWQPDLDAPQARRALAGWYQLYRKRRANLAPRARGSTLIEIDSAFTYVEGIARYVESSFLLDATQHPPQPIVGDPLFSGFAKWEGRGYGAMPNRQLDPEYYYALGFHLALLLDRAEPSWKQRVPFAPSWLIGLVQAAVTDGARRAEDP
jgi:hypothetical protein